MSTPRVAVVIGNGSFREDSGLLPLNFPAADAAAVADLFRNPKCGKFDVVESLVDKNSSEIKRSFERISREQYGSFVLIFYSGHGLLSDNGRLYLASADTDKNYLSATAVRFAEVIETFRDRGHDRLGVILDCCHAGAAGQDFKNSIEGAISSAVDGRGTFLIGACAGSQLAKEKAELGHGVLTSALVTGLTTGKADRDRDGRVSHLDLAAWCSEYVRKYAPQDPPFATNLKAGEFTIGWIRRTIEPDEAESARDLLHSYASLNILSNDTRRQLESWLASVAPPIPTEGSIQARFLDHVRGDCNFEDVLAAVVLPTEEEFARKLEQHEKEVRAEMEIVITQRSLQIEESARKHYSNNLNSTDQTLLMRLMIIITFLPFMLVYFL